MLTSVRREAAEHETLLELKRVNRLCQRCTRFKALNHCFFRRVDAFKLCFDSGRITSAAVDSRLFA